MKVNLVKESDNEADKEAIKVELPGFGITAISPEYGTYYTHIPLYSWYNRFIRNEVISLNIKEDAFYGRRE